MGEERGERSADTDLETSPTDESTGDSGLEPSGGPRRVVSGESVDDVVASLKSTKTGETETETGAQTDRTDANADAQQPSNGSSSGSSSEADASESRSPPAPTDESTPGMVDLEDLSADAGPLAGRLQPDFGADTRIDSRRDVKADSGADLTNSQPGSRPSVESDSTTNTGDGSPAGSDVEKPVRDRADGSTRADDSDAASIDAPDGTDNTDATDDGQPSGLLARIKQFFFG